MNDNPYASPGGTPGHVVFDPHAPPPRATFTLGYPTLHLAIRLFFWRHAGVRLFICSAVLVGAAVIVVTELARGEVRPLLPHLVFLALVLVVLNSRPFFYIVASLTLLLIRAKKTLAVAGENIVEVKDGELLDSTQVERFAVKLSAVLMVYQARGLIIVALPRGKFLVIPESADFGADSFDTFYAKLKAAADAAKTSDGATST